jgi:hypothetical protein
MSGADDAHASGHFGLPATSRVLPVRRFDAKGSARTLHRRRWLHGRDRQLRWPRSLTRMTRQRVATRHWCSPISSMGIDKREPHGSAISLGPMAFMASLPRAEELPILPWAFFKISVRFSMMPRLICAASPSLSTRFSSRSRSFSFAKSVCGADVRSDGR